MVDSPRPKKSDEAGPTAEAGEGLGSWGDGDRDGVRVGVWVG